MIKESILREVSAYIEKGFSSALDAKSAKQLAIFNVLLRNNTGGSIDMGIFSKATNPKWKAYSYTAIGTVLTEITSAIQAGTNTTLFAADGDGLYVGATKKFGLIGLNGTTAGGGSPVFTVKYYNGTSFVTLNNFTVFTNIASGENHIVFAPPVDWAKGGLSGGDSDKYHVEVIATTAPTVTIPVANYVWLGVMHAFRTAVSSNGTIEITTPDSDRPLILESGEGVLPYFGTADVGNTVEYTYNNF